MSARMRSQVDTAVRANPSITVRFRFFARYAELLGLETTSIHLTAPATVADAVAVLRARFPGGNVLPERPLVALNQEHVLGTRPVQDGDELALLPPLAGG